MENDDSSHGPLQCRAKSKRSGVRCRRHVTPGKKVCYYHGGRNPGGPHNLKHGYYTKEAIENRRQIRQLIKEACQLIDDAMFD